MEEDDDHWEENRRTKYSRKMLKDEHQLRCTNEMNVYTFTSIRHCVRTVYWPCQQQQQLHSLGIHVHIYQTLCKNGALAVSATAAAALARRTRSHLSDTV